MAEIIIKKLVFSDLSDVVDVIRVSFATVAKDFGLTEQNFPTHTSFMTLERLQDTFNRCHGMYVLYEEGRIAGFVALSNADDKVFKLHNLAVLPEYRHKGLGRQLLNFCKEQVVQSNGCKICLDIIEENTRLKNWYAANGFTHTGVKVFPRLPFTVGYMEWVK